MPELKVLATILGQPQSGRQPEDHQAHHEIRNLPQCSEEASKATSTTSKPAIQRPATVEMSMVHARWMNTVAEATSDQTALAVRLINRKEEIS